MVAYRANSSNVRNRRESLLTSASRSQYAALRLLNVYVFHACRLTVFAIMLYPTISDRILRTKDRECKFEQADNFYPSIAISVLGGHLPSLIIVACYVIVYVEIRKLVRTRPTDNIRIGTPNATRRPSVAADAARSHGACGTDEGASRRSPEAVDVRVNDAKRNSLQHPKTRVKRRLSAPSIPGFEVDVARPGTAAADPTGSEINALDGRRISSGLQKRTGSIALHVSESSSSAMKREGKVFVTLSYIVIAYIICWVPYHFVFDFSIFRPQLVPENLFTVTFWMTYVNSLLNPFLYALSMADVRKSIAHILECKLSRCYNDINL
jgi:hypothetical protein